MTDPIDLKSIGKLLEELGECTSAAARCQIQGLLEAEPTTGKVNKKWLEDEIADVLANINIVIDRFDLDVDTTRINRKMANLRKWHSGA